MQTKSTIEATIWMGDIDDPLDGPIVLESEPAVVDVERTDEDEVALHVTLPGDANALVSVYLTRAQAALVAATLTQKAVA